MKAQHHALLGPSDARKEYLKLVQAEVEREVLAHQLDLRVAGDVEKSLNFVGPAELVGNGMQKQRKLLLLLQ